MPFYDRSDAGKGLAAALSSYRNAKPVVLALPRGGVPVATEVAAYLGAPLDLILVRKIGVPSQPELAMGAVVDGGRSIVVRNEEVIQAAGVTEQEFQTVCSRELAEIARRHRLYLSGRPPVDVTGRTAIVVDDGLATGATTRAALGAVRARKPKTLVLAVPVAPSDTLAAMRAEADDVVCLESYDSFSSIGSYYVDFRQITDEEVTDTLAAFAKRPQSSESAGVSR